MKFRLIIAFTGLCLALVACSGGGTKQAGTERERTPTASTDPPSSSGGGAPNTDSTTTDVELGGGTNSEASMLVGRWVFEPSAEQKAQMGGNIPKSEFVFTPDGKFKMTGTSGTESVTVIGSWKLDGKKATLTPESLGGKKPQNEMEKKPLVITLSEDGKSFTPEDSGVPVRYVRK